MFPNCLQQTVIMMSSRRTLCSQIIPHEIFSFISCQYCNDSGLDVKYFLCLLNFLRKVFCMTDRDSIVGIVTGDVLDNQGARISVLVGARIFTSPYYPDWLWGPPSLLCNGSFLRGKVTEA
jgi:hypothetical protein